MTKTLTQIGNFDCGEYYLLVDSNAEVTFFFAQRNYEPSFSCYIFDYSGEEIPNLTQYPHLRGEFWNLYAKFPLTFHNDELDWAAYEDYITAMINPILGGNTNEPENHPFD